MTDTSGFLPSNYVEPTGSGSFLRLEKGTTTLRIVSSAVTGYVGWDRSGETPIPVRAESALELKDLDTKEDRVKHFWLCAVLDRETDSISLWEITQGTIQKAIKALVSNPDWGSPDGYDIAVTRNGEGLKTTYSVMPSPKKPLKLSPENQEMLKGMKLENIFIDGEDIFG